MGKAKTFNSTELRRVLDYIATRKHAARNRVMLLLTHWGGMRVGEVAALRYCDVLNSDGTVKDEINLSAEQTKGKHSRTVFVSTKLRKEVCRIHRPTSDEGRRARPFLYAEESQTRIHCQHAHTILSAPIPQCRHRRCK